MSLPRHASDFPPGFIAKHYTDPDSGISLLVRTGSFSFCAYVGVAAGNVIAGLDEFNFKCHHGITLSEWGGADNGLPSNMYWWGWDYGHFSNVTELDTENPQVTEITKDMQALIEELKEQLGLEGVELPRIKQKRWTLEEVVEDAFDVLVTLKQQLNQSESLSHLVTLGI